MKSTKLFLFIVLFLASCVAPTMVKPTQTFTPKPTSTSTPTPFPTSSMTPAPTQIGGGSSKLIFVYRKEEFIKAFPDLQGETNVFTSNIDGTNLVPITNGLEGYNYFESVSPDGTKVLIASTSNEELKNNQDSILYLIDLNSLDSKPTEIAKGSPTFYGRNSVAKWIDNAQIVYIGQGEAGFGIYTVNIDSANPRNIYKYNNDGAGNRPFEILAINKERVYWDTQITTSLGGNRSNSKYYIWSTSFDSIERVPLEFNGNQLFFENVFGHNLVFSPDNTKVAWIEKATPESGPPYNNYLHIALISDINNPYTLETLTGLVILKWWPDSSKILVFDVNSLNNPENSTNELYGVYEVSTDPDLPTKNLYLPTDILKSKIIITGGYISALMDLYDISPDGRQLICATYEKNADGNFDTKLNFLDLETITFSDANEFTFSNRAISGVHWLP